MMSIARQGMGVASALLIALVCGALFIAATGSDPLQVYSTMLVETLGTSYGIGQVLFKATTLIFTGLSAAICFRAGLFNIGGEGQLMAGAFLIAVAGAFGGGLSPVVMIPLCILAGIAGGALWALVPGILKARFGSHEVINTIMMNYIAAALVGFLVNSVFGVPATVHTAVIAEGAQLPRLDNLFGLFQGSPANASFLLAVLCCVLVWLFFARTRWGYELRAVGLNPVAAACARIDVPSRYAIALLLSGAFAGLGGSNFVMGYKRYYEIGFSDNAGFIGIAVALLSNNNPIGVIFASLFFALLEYGGLTINVLVPKELVTILQAIVILLVVVLSKLFNDRFAVSRRHLFAGGGV